MPAMAKGDGAAGGIIDETAKQVVDGILARSNEVQLPAKTLP